MYWKYQPRSQFRSERTDPLPHVKIQCHISIPRIVGGPVLFDCSIGYTVIADSITISLSLLRKILEWCLRPGLAKFNAEEDHTILSWLTCWSHICIHILISYAFFFVILQCLNFVCQHFRTLCMFHLHRQIGMKNDWIWECQEYLYGKRFGSKIAWAIRKEGDRIGVGPSRETGCGG